MEVPLPLGKVHNSGLLQEVVLDVSTYWSTLDVGEGRGGEGKETWELGGDDEEGEEGREDQTWTKPYS